MQSKRLKILYIGPDYLGSNGTAWRDAFLELGHDVRTVDDERMVPGASTVPGKVWRKMAGRPPMQRILGMNDAILREVRRFRPDFSFFVKAYYILPSTLDETRTYGPNLAYMNDDMFNRQNQTFPFFDNIRRMDCILTTKSFNVREYHAAGAPCAIYVPNAFDPRIHYPAQPTETERRHYEGDVAFIGTFRSDRADFLAKLANLGGEFRLNLWGSAWEKVRRLDYWPKAWAWRNLVRCIRGRELWGPDMGKAIQSNSICLGLLFHGNRDLHTSRSFEIPACGGFMLAERTEEHRLYFEEDREAVYFSCFEEMVQKIRFYLPREEARRKIAMAGYERCQRSAATYSDRAAFALRQYERLRPAASFAGALNAPAESR